MKIIKLKAKDQVRIPYDQYSPTITIETAKDFFADGTYLKPDGLTFGNEIRPFDLESWKIWEAKCGRDWGREYVYGLRETTMITDNHLGKVDYRKMKDEAYANAVTIDDGDVIEVDGMLFKTFVIKRAVSDQIRFTFIGVANELEQSN